MKPLRDEKSIVIAYVIWFFLGQLGVHRMYLGRVKSGFAMLGLLLGAFAIFIVFGLADNPRALNDTVLMIMAISAFSMLAVWFIWYIVDVVLIAIMVSRDRQAAQMNRPDTMERVFE